MCGKVLQESKCEGCNQEEETTGHLFWMSPRACKLWQCSKMVFLIETSHCISFKDLLWSLLMADQPRIELADKVVTCAWALWHNRNEVQLGGARKMGKVLL